MTPLEYRGRVHRWGLVKPVTLQYPLSLALLTWRWDLTAPNTNLQHISSAAPSSRAGEIWHCLPESHTERWTLQVLSSSQHGGYFCFRLVSVLFLSLVILTWYSCSFTGQRCATGQADPPYLRLWLFISLMLQKIKEAREMGFIYDSDKHTNWTLL